MHDFLARWWDELGLSRWLSSQGQIPRSLVAAGLFVILLTVLQLGKSLAGRRTRKLADKRRSGYAELAADLIDATRFLFLAVESAFFASLVLQRSDWAWPAIRATAVIVLLIQAGIWGHVAVAFYVNRYTRRRMETDATSVTTITALGVLARLVIISTVVLLILDNLGMDITALVAGLGIGGVAVALAAQTILGDLFASASIVLDRPFAMGDFVIVDDYLGTVERVGLKTTRIRSLSGEQLVFPNSDLLRSRIRNYKRMVERRVVFSIGVVYQTPCEKITRTVEILRGAVEAQQQVRFDRAHFKEYGDFSLKFEIVYYVLSPDYNLSMDIQQAINLAIYERFENEQIEFAYPTQTVFFAPPGALVRTMKTSFLSVAPLRRRSWRASRSSCWYEPWNFSKAASPAENASLSRPIRR